MKYDRDIRWTRIGAWCLAAGNLGAAVWNGINHNWSIAIACAIWIYNCLLLLRSMRFHQNTRDQGRVLEAMFNSVCREME